MCGRGDVSKHPPHVRAGSSNDQLTYNFNIAPCLISLIFPFQKDVHGFISYSVEQHTVHVML